MTRRQLHKLSAKEVESAKPGRHSDGGGLYLVVGDGGARSWLFMYKERHREAARAWSWLRREEGRRVPRRRPQEG
jgi:hypothetical protein